MILVIVPANVDLQMQYKKQTHCSRGHDQTNPANVSLYRRYNVCLLCRQVRNTEARRIRKISLKEVSDEELDRRALIILRAEGLYC